MQANMLTDLDTLFDTRFALLKKINLVEANELLLSGKYHNRVKDDYGNISYDIFKPLWDRRNKYVLSNAVNTYMLQFIAAYYLEAFEKILNFEIANKMTLYVNVYPYKLTSEEASQFESGIAKCLPNLLIKTIYKPWKELDTTWVVENVNTVFMYETMDWLEYHMYQCVYNINMKKVMCYAPAVTRATIESEKVDTAELVRISDDLNLFAKVEFLPVSFFSAITNVFTNDENKIKKEKSS